MTTREELGSAVSGPARKDKKRYLWILGLVVPTLPLAGLVLQNAAGQGIWLRAHAGVFLGVIP